MEPGQQIEIRVRVWTGADGWRQPSDASAPPTVERWIPAVIDEDHGDAFVARATGDDGRVLLTMHDVEPREGQPATWRLPRKAVRV